ncbi:MAG: ABC transporter ATP-binding protein [Lewinellaceae bacterium]|nr:ABC transporter ATP-binding protein [Lewinellaceae bacterium]
MTDPIISIKNLRKQYGPKQVLRGIDLDVYPGQVLGYIGPNGAGKSTTVKILCGLQTDFSGTVMVRGIDIRQDPVGVRQYIGYVPESADLYDVLTASEFLHFMGALYGLPKDTCDNRIQKMMGAFGMAANLDQRIDTFSKGMRQKVLLVSSLLHNPDIIILDEPLNGLDANSVIMVKVDLQACARRQNVLYCSHMMDVVEKVSDRIVLINDGRIVADGSIESLKQQGDQSLEQIFSQLTNNGMQGHAADDLMRAFEP